ncbi:hypothetical protein OSB04_un001303 [Centaurea solstitialis]|uniref:Uncharacterized protein n=1 Tax=Centaurea solstitialis TaxID=347529 RepID=A0AA38SB05_9ASTR|nr:hypothetical protein OSB04_un001303 [Centaurea solstitialis]
MLEIESFENKRLLVDWFLDGLSDNESDGAPSFGCVIGDRGISEIGSIIFSEDAPAPSYSDVVQENASNYTDESNHLDDQDISKLKLKEEASYNFCPHLDLVHVLRTFMIQSDLIEHQKQAAMQLRLVMKFNPKNRVKIAMAGAITPLISLISSSDPQLQEHCVTAILYLSLSDESNELLAASGAIGPLVTALKVGTSTAKENVICTLLRLSQLEENKTAIGRSGAIPLLVDLLETGNLLGKQATLTVLSCLCSVKENKIRAVEAGIMKPLVELMADFKLNMVDKSASVIGVLASLPEARAALVEEGGIPLLMKIVDVGSQWQKKIKWLILLQYMVYPEGAIPTLAALSQFGTKISPSISSSTSSVNHFSFDFSGNYFSIIDWFIADMDRNHLIVFIKLLRAYIHLLINAFEVLCEMLKTRGGFLDEGNVTIEEQVATFVNILAHYTKNRCIQVRFYRSGETISRYVHRVLCALLRLEDILFKKPTPVTDDCSDSRWKWFKGCLGAIDGTYIEVTVPESDKTKVSNKKGTYCNKCIRCSSTDSRVLRDAITRHNGLKVPIGNYYLADAGYINGEGFLAPYRGTRYHLREWENGGRVPTNKEEYFNMKHSQAGNIIERMYMDIDPEENTTITLEDMPIGEDQPNEFDSIDVVEATYDMLNTSGFGWDDARQCVTVDSPEILEEYLKKHPNKNYTANKPFPTYERLSIIFGKDRATGSMAESATDAVENMNMETEDFIETEVFSVPLSNPSNVASGSAAPSGGETSTRKKKRKAAATDDMTKLIIEKGLASVSDEMHQLITVITSSSPNLDGLDILPNELKDMGLNAMQIVRVSMYFGKNPTQLRIWKGLDASLKPAFVKTILEEDK